MELVTKAVAGATVLYFFGLALLKLQDDNLDKLIMFGYALCWYFMMLFLHGTPHTTYRERGARRY